MARPKKPRFFDSVELADNLYPDAKKRIGMWRYKLPNGKDKVFKAVSADEANKAAIKANNQRELYFEHEAKKQSLTIVGKLVDEFIAHREITSPDLKLNRSWKNRCYALHKFARNFTLPPNKLTRAIIESWWHTLSYNDQKLRHAEFRKFFNYLMGKGYTPQLEYNPFTTADDRPRLYLKTKPPRARERLSEKGFWAIYHQAGILDLKGLQIAMGLSLTTFMREQDILSLRFDQHIKGELLQRIISKSEAQKGYAKAARLQWNTQSHPLLRQLVQQARELSLKNGGCPYLVSHIPKRIYKSEQKTHHAQLTKERLSEQFREARAATELWLDCSSPPSFHEIRSLGDMLASRSGFDIKAIQHAMAHSNEAMTMMYQANHDLPFEEVEVVFTNSMIGGLF